MPTVLRIDGYRFFFYSNENREPPHIHVESGDGLAKFWLEPVALAMSVDYNASELRALQRLVEAHQTELVVKWNEFFSR